MNRSCERRPFLVAFEAPGRSGVINRALANRCREPDSRKIPARETGTRLRDAGTVVLGPSGTVVLGPRCGDSCPGPSLRSPNCLGLETAIIVCPALKEDSCPQMSYERQACAQRERGRDRDSYSTKAYLYSTRTLLRRPLTPVAELIPVVLPGGR